ncbi:hypothetical protein, partial [Actinomadura sp. CNU-125]|uniref:hypothetical protein n=1 Tax=Actinomadura sp. CNU-125 TaxID=1904961 RepID=UPI003966C565
MGGERRGRADGTSGRPAPGAAGPRRPDARELAATLPVPVDGPRLLAERAAFTGHRRGGTVSAGGSCAAADRDGWAAVSCARPDDPALLGAVIGAELPPDPWPAVSAWLRAHPGAELAERAELLGVAAGPVERTRRPPVPSPLTPRPVEGLLVVDFSALWAGPLCAHLLGLAGSRVVEGGHAVGARTAPAAATRASTASCTRATAPWCSTAPSPAAAPPWRRS